MRRLAGIALLVIATVFWSTSGWAQRGCQRHFYNNSNYFWTVRLGVQARCNGSRSCQIAPFAVANLTYDNPDADMFITISSFNYNKTYWIGGGACRIMHDGSTGLVALNSPADGDVVTCGNESWPCYQVLPLPGCFRDKCGPGKRARAPRP
jgi:hypothetical protein